MFKKLLATDDSTVALILRVTLGAIMFAHGAQKAFGWFGGYGFEGTMGFLTGALGLPAAVAAIVIVGELLAALGLIGGLLTRAAAAGTIAIMAGAVAMVHAPNGFFMNWSGKQAGEGYELHLLAAGMAFALVLLGGGKASLDRALARRAA